MLATNITIKKIHPSELKDTTYKDQLVNFLFESLEQYTDPVQDIHACLQYILDEQKGGHVFVAENESKKISGVVFLCKTRMETFVPEYLLVYIATDKNMRGQGVGKKLLKAVKEDLKAPIALHVEHANPAKKLYEQVGFTNKYTEMRWHP